MLFRAVLGLFILLLCGGNCVNHNHKAIEVEHPGTSESKTTRTSKDEEGENKNEMFDSRLASWDL
jgi:hypothetical protein